MKRTSIQNRMFHGRLGDWSQGIKTAYNQRYSKGMLKMFAKREAYATGDAKYASFPDLKTSEMDTAAMDEFINIMEAAFSQYWPDAYVPARGDEKWG